MVGYLNDIFAITIKAIFECVGQATAHDFKFFMVKL